ncbi:MAG: oleate hydratase [Ignavibacteriaceae bacterium]|nr:oleate hydratase [Ignavibacteriaceae bacterium]
MKKCIVIGGGFAGLTSAAYLVNSGCKVELIEASPKLGGRAYSFLHKESGEIIDNGQHLLMGCYIETLKLLKLINALDKIEIQKRLEVKFLKPGFEQHELKTSSAFYPINFAAAVLRYSAISFSERLSILKFFLKLPFLSKHDLEKKSVEELLIRENQSENVRKALWEIVSVGALNTSLKKASAKVFTDVLKEIFLKGNDGSRLVLPKVGLSQMFCEPAKQFIEDHGGKIYLSEKVEKIKVEKGNAVELSTNERKIIEFDYVIFAVPFYSAKKFLPSIGAADFIPQYSSILNVHVWLAQNKFDENFYGLIDSKLHWVFCHGKRINCVISDADYLLLLSDEEIMNMIYTELENYLNIKREEITRYLILKEKRATFIPSREILNNRPDTQTEVKNLFLAGDWVNTGLPSTIESAVKSGRMAADAVASRLEARS